MLQFRADIHEYRWQGAVVPSVTTVLASILGGPPDTPNVRAAAERGTIVHETVALDLAGDLDEASVDPQVAPYLAAARLFCRECGFAPDLREHRLCHAQHLFAGTVDAFETKRRVLVDWKSGEPKKEHAIQTAAYSLLMGDLAGTERIAVYLRPDGTYRAEKHGNYNRDRGAFLSLLAAHRVKESLK